MKISRDNFGELLTPIHKKIIWDAYRSKPEQYSNLFKSDTANQKTVSYPHLGGFGMWSTNTEGNVINEDTMSQGDVATFEPVRYDKGYSITWEMVQDDLYNVMKGLGKGGTAKALGRGLQTTKETVAANVINNGFSNVGYDGVSLFNSAHPLIDSASTGSNLITGALTDSNLKDALVAFKKTPDEAGLKVISMADKMFIASNLEFTAKTILRSSGPANELSNDSNTLPSLGLVMMDYIDDDMWGLKDSSFDNLLWLWWNKPLFDSQPIQKTVDHFVFGYSRFDGGYVDWRGIAASLG